MKDTPLAMIDTKREKCDICGSRAHWYAYTRDINFCHDCSKKTFNWKNLKITVVKD
tara:strand:+ start:1836 stop:2003 length:168 start_codon:yes stop_codon:yes gene_type:complete